MSDLLSVPTRRRSPRISTCAFSTPTSIGMAVETWLRATSLHLQLSPKGSLCRLRVGTRQASVQIVLEAGRPGTTFEIAEPEHAEARRAWLRLLQALPKVEVDGLTTSGRPFGGARVHHDGFDPRRDKDWVVRVLQHLGVDWVDLHGDALGWA